MHFQHIKNLQLPFDIDEKEGKNLFGKGTKKLILVCSKGSYVHEQNLKQLKIHGKLNHCAKLLA